MVVEKEKVAKKTKADHTEMRKYGWSTLDKTKMALLMPRHAGKTREEATIKLDFLLHATKIVIFHSFLTDEIMQKTIDLVPVER